MKELAVRTYVHVGESLTCNIKLYYSKILQCSFKPCQLFYLLNKLIYINIRENTERVNLIEL